MPTFGGATVKSLGWTDALGQSPGSGNAGLVGTFALSAGQDFTLSIGGKSIAGVVKNPVRSVTPEGVSWDVTLVDNREKLGWDPIACEFNIVDTKSVDPNDFGKSRKRRYKHIYPDDWHAQIVTYTDNPLTAKQCLDRIFAYGGLRYSWTYVNHAALSKPVYSIDADTGTTLGNLIQQILDKLSLLMCLTGAYQLTFFVKGEGSIPSYTGANCKETSEGAAMSNQPTAVRMVGDRNLYQDINVPMEKDWIAYWEDYVFEADLWVKVKELWTLEDDTASKRAYIAAAMRKVTLADWAAKTGSGAGNDYGRFGEVMRMNIPVWVYVNEIVYKAYRIVRSYTINDIPLLSMELTEGLLARATVDTTTGVMSYYTGVGGALETYTDDKAYIAAQGQPLDLSDPAKKDVLDPATTSALRDLWQPVQRFRFDAKNYTVIFEDALFRPGTGADALFVSVNAETDLPEDHPSKYLAVPNPAAVIEAAPITGAFTFAVERYHRDFGSGIRNGISYISGLSLHSLLVTNIYQTEILYDTSPRESADTKAQKAAASVLAKQQLYASGRVKRLGTAGAPLAGQLDRTSITYDTTGLAETIEYTKERGPNYFESERELERRQASDDLFPGMQDTRRAVRDYAYMSKVLAGLNARAEAPAYRSINEVGKKPLGNTDPATTTVHPDAALSYDAGEAVFADGNRVIAEDGAIFLGVAIAKGHSAGQPLDVATQGDVPVKVVGPVIAGAAIGCNSGSRNATVNGSRFIGICKESYAGTQTVWLPVRLSAAAPPSSDHPLKLIDASTVADGAQVRVTYGTYAGVKADAGMNPGDSPIFKMAVSDGDYIYEHITLAFSGGSWSITGRAVEAGAAVPGSTPTNFYDEIGSVHVTAAVDGDHAPVVKPVNAITDSRAFVQCGSQDAPTRSVGY